MDVEKLTKEECPELQDLMNSAEELGEMKLATKVLSIMNEWNGKNDTDLIVDIRNMCKQIGESKCTTS